MNGTSVINAAAVKALIKDLHPGKRISPEYLAVLNANVRQAIVYHVGVCPGKRTLRSDVFLLGGVRKGGKG